MFFRDISFVEQMYSENMDMVGQTMVFHYPLI